MDEPTCSVDGCDRQAKSRGWCQTHYCRWKRTGDVGANVPVKGHLPAHAPHATCAVEGCGRSPKGGSRGWCHAHFERWRTNGDVNADVPLTSRVKRYAPDVTCSVEGCDGSPSSGGRGWCGAHYARWQATGDVQADLPVMRRDSLPAGAPCIVEDCEKPVQCRDMCGTHYARQLRHGDPFYAPERPTACSVDGCGKKPKSRGLCEAHYMRLLRYGDPEYLADKNWNAFYVVTGAGVVKFGITSGDARSRLRVHAANGYTDIVRLVIGLPGSVARDTEDAVKSALALAGERPVCGWEYFDISCLALVLDVADSWLNRASPPTATDIACEWVQDMLFAA